MTRARALLIRTSAAGLLAASLCACAPTLDGPALACDAGQVVISEADGGLGCAQAAAGGSGVVVIYTANGPVISAAPFDGGPDFALLSAHLDALDASVGALLGSAAQLDASVQLLESEITGLDASVIAAAQIIGSADASVRVAAPTVATLTKLSSTDQPGTPAARDGQGSFAANNAALDGSLVLFDGGIKLQDALVLQRDFSQANCFIGEGGTIAAQPGASGNTALGFQAQYSLRSGANNTATGAVAMGSRGGGARSTALGANAMSNGTSNDQATAIGSAALAQDIANDNNAIGAHAMGQVTTGTGNVAIGTDALINGANENVAAGWQALTQATSSGNTAIGYAALGQHHGGAANVAIGRGALGVTSGFGNLAIGALSGKSVADGGSYNLDLSSPASATDQNALRIGATGMTAAYIAGISGVPVAGSIAMYVSGSSQLGVSGSSRRFKQEIEDIGAASGILMALRPVAFKYRPEFDASASQQYGLIAEEVAQRSAALVAFGSDGRPITVRYEQIDALLLHRCSPARRTPPRSRSAAPARS